MFETVTNNSNNKTQNLNGYTYIMHCSVLLYSEYTVLLEFDAQLHMNHRETIFSKEMAHCRKYLTSRPLHCTQPNFEGNRERKFYSRCSERNADGIFNSPSIFGLENSALSNQHQIIGRCSFQIR
jgi:hypothetical protein